jgi:hypothetical protein
MVARIAEIELSVARLDPRDPHQIVRSVSQVARHG